MTAIEIARTFAAHQQVADAQKAYTLVLRQADGTDPAAELEAAAYLFDSGDDYRVPYTCFQSLYNRGHFCQELMDLMVSAFYAPNLKPQQRMYERNCKLLNKYPYCFRKEFPAFDALPIKFFPFNDEGYIPFDTRADRFGEYMNFHDTVIDRNFFQDLDNPIFAADVYSQYQLEYLNDNVRRSEWVGRENHIYLHYTDWAVFCAYLQCLDLRDLLKSEKLVFLAEEEKALYPIDFKERFGIDYSQYPVKPFSVKEVKRLIWHTQLSSHNGGDFFNEIFYGHPNLLADQSVMLNDVHATVENMKKGIRRAEENSKLKAYAERNNMDYSILKQLSVMKDLTAKDVLVAMFLCDFNINKELDRNARIAPALFFQPHFPNMVYEMTTDEHTAAVLHSNQYDEISSSPIFNSFQYIKTMTPMRRLTTSYAATVKFIYDNSDAGKKEAGELVAEGEQDKKEIFIGVVSDVLSQRLLNRSFMVDPRDRLYRDSILVRFEDGKLNPKATFTALAAFLDLPYTQSMTYCSGVSGLNPESLKGNALGFDLSTVYRTYDEYANNAERYFLEYFMRDVYECYGYGFQYYDEKPVDDEKIRELIAGFTTLNDYIKRSWRGGFRGRMEICNADTQEVVSGEEEERVYDSILDQQIKAHDERRLEIAQILQRGLNFVNREGQPLRMTPLLKLDPALLENPLYH